MTSVDQPDEQHEYRDAESGDFADQPATEQDELDQLSPQYQEVDLPGDDGGESESPGNEEPRR